MFITPQEAVHAANEMARYKATELNRILEVLRTSTGKMFLKYGALSKKGEAMIGVDVDFQLEPLRPDGFARVHYAYIRGTEHGNHIYMTVSLSFNGGSYDDNSQYCHYTKSEFWVCDVDNGAVSVVADDYTPDYIDAEAETANIKLAESLKEQFHAANGKLTPENRIRL